MNNQQYFMNNQQYFMNNQQYFMNNQQYFMSNQQYFINNKQYFMNNPLIRIGKNMYKKYICKKFIHNKLVKFEEKEMCKYIIFEHFVSNYVASRDCIEAQQLEALQHLSEEVKDFEKLFSEPFEQPKILKK